MRLALYQPDIPQNTGTIIRLCACFNLPLDIIEPCGFVFSESKMRRAGMDYIDDASISRHDSWQKYQEQRKGRLILLTTKGASSLYDFKFEPDDNLMMGRESAGVPDEVASICDGRLRIPMKAGARSLNVAISAAISVAEALRQTKMMAE